MSSPKNAVPLTSISLRKEGGLIRNGLDPDPFGTDRKLLGAGWIDGPFLLNMESSLVAFIAIPTSAKQLSRTTESL